MNTRFRHKGRSRNNRHHRKKQVHYLPLRRVIAAAAALVLIAAGAYTLFLKAASWPLGWSIQVSGESASSSRPEPPYTIAVDAGHGGIDPGATGVIVERDMTAATAQALIQLLEKDENFLPVETRESYDTTATPIERAEYANRQNPDLLLSIHGNSSPDSTEASGFECYPVTPGRTWHAESLSFAQKLASEMEAAGNSLRGQGGIRYLYYNEENEKILAEANNTQIREEGTFTILEETECPAVLVEQCFVTNPEDVDRFGDTDGIERAAQAYYYAICDYFDVEPLE